MKNKIKNREDLQAEIKRLQLLADNQEKVVRADISFMREQLRPKNILLNAIESITGIKVNTKDLFMNGLGAGLLLLIRKSMSKAESKAEDKLYEFTDNVVSRIRKFLSSIFNVRKHYREEEEQHDE